MNQATGSSTRAKSHSKADALIRPAVTPPRIAPLDVAISSVMPSRMFAVPRSTFVLATALEVAITETMLAATA